MIAPSPLANAPTAFHRDPEDRRPRSWIVFGLENPRRHRGQSVVVSTTIARHRRWTNAPTAFHADPEDPKAAKLNVFG